MTPKIQVFEYNGQNISFDFGDGNRMINATEMAKLFNKRPIKFLELSSTKHFIEILKVRKSDFKNFPIVKTVKGGHYRGTWMHEKLALKFAAWLSPEFEVWVYDRIHELLHQGYTTIRPQAQAFQNITFIYFFKAVNIKRIKIGMSRNVHQRLGIVQTTSPVELELIKIIRTNERYPTDVAIHGMFQHLRLHNEWFELTPELQAFIDELDSVPIGEATAYYEQQLIHLRRQLEEERQKINQKNQLIQSLTWQLGKVQQEYQHLLGKWQGRKELPSVHSLSPASPPQDSAGNPLPSINIPSQTIYLLRGKQYHQVHTKDIAYLKPVQGGAICALSDGELYRSELSMTDSLKQLPAHSFMKVHRSHVINLHHLTSIDTENRKITLCKKIEVSLSTKYLQLLLERLKFLKKKSNR